MALCYGGPSKHTGTPLRNDVRAGIMLRVGLWGRLGLDLELWYVLEYLRRFCAGHGVRIKHRQK